MARRKAPTKKAPEKATDSEVEKPNARRKAPAKKAEAKEEPETKKPAARRKAPARKAESEPIADAPTAKEKPKRRGWFGRKKKD